ncbi:MAG TPA: 5'/3'-nucleotidase SurE [Erysipelotrichaceae bacterium]|nr:5'/3'-nucleotidase SurE [Erysipelotrichaceae bacterium]
MKILLVNDDGYQAQGLKLLHEKLKKIGDVTVVVPYSNMSGKSVSLTIRGSLKVEKIDEQFYAIHGTPADCTSFALNGLNQKFDLVVTGCNDGHNLSYDVLFSGTVGAALIGSISGHKAIAFSCPFDDFYGLVNNFEEVWNYVLKYDLLSENYVLNVNFPNGSPKGIKLGKLYYRRDYNYYKKDEQGYYGQRDLENYLDMPEDADARHVDEGYISIVPVSNKPFDERLLEKLKLKVS